MFDLYYAAFWAILVMILTVMVQSLIAATVKASQPDAVPGKIDDALSHSSFVFRANRTFSNSLENITMMLGAAFLAILVSADPLWVTILVWVMAVARIIHMMLYYCIATEKNPSPRSYFFLIGFFANITLLVVCALVLI